MNYIKAYYYDTDSIMLENTVYYEWYRESLEKDLIRWAENLGYFRGNSLKENDPINHYIDFMLMSVNEYLHFYSMLTGGRI